MKREAHLPKSQKALRTMVDRINAQAQEKGTKHNRFSALPEGLLSGYKTFFYPQKVTATSSCTTPSQSTNASSSPRRTALSPSRLSMSSAPSSQLNPNDDSFTQTGDV
jgi:hypothetical protein